MDAFNYRDGELCAEGVGLSALAERFGTPTYVYSRAHIEAQYRSYTDALQGTSHLVCFAVKANSNLGVLNVLARLGAGFDIVSGGELERVLAAGGRADRVVFSGVGKTRADMRRALEVGVHCFNIESSEELERLQQVAAEMGVRAPVSLRVNPDVDAGTHPYISTGLKENKFGIAIADAEEGYVRAAQLPNLEIVGVDCHIGSQLTSLEPFLDALDRILMLVDRLGDCGILLNHLDLGGGLGVRYRDEVPPLAGDYIKAVRERLGDPALTLLDARALPRFRGEVEPIDPVAGHITGAQCAAFTENLGADGHFLPADTLKARFAALLGERKPEELVAYCGSGVTACHNLFALSLAGYPLAPLYAGSWSEWITDPQRQVATGD